MADYDNRQHIDATQGKVLVNGEEVKDAVSFTATFTPITFSSKTLGHVGDDTRWKGFRITGSLSEFRSSPWYLDMINTFKETNATPEFIVQGIVTDESSDYFREYGGQSITLIGCIPTGDLNLMTLDANADSAQDTITFSAKDFVMKTKD